MFTFLNRMTKTASLVALAATLSGDAAAQSLFAPVAKIDDYVVTAFELDQRVMFLTALGLQGDIEGQSLDKLIEERLQQSAADQFGMTLTDENLTIGMEEFAQRSEATTDEFLELIGQQGVAPQTFRDFILASLLWREVVRERFGPFVVVDDTDIDRAISLQGTTGGVRILFSEIFLPTNSVENTNRALDLAPKIARLKTVEEFADAARRFSVGESRTQGGRVEDWINVADLPPQIGELLMDMQPGDITQPLEIPNALALFQLRDIGETPAPRPKNLKIDYAAYYIDGGQSGAAQSRAAKIRNEIDTCDDLYAIAKGQPATVLDRENLPVSKIPRDYALELARLDVNESSTALTRNNGQTLVFLMLCRRDRDAQTFKDDAEESAYRETIRAQLFNQRLVDMADAYMEELRAEAVIIRR